MEKSVVSNSSKLAFGIAAILFAALLAMVFFSQTAFAATASGNSGNDSHPDMRLQAVPTLASDSVDLAIFDGLMYAGFANGQEVQVCNLPAECRVSLVSGDTSIAGGYFMSTTGSVFVYPVKAGSTVLSFAVSAFDPSTGVVGVVATLDLKVQVFEVSVKCSKAMNNSIVLYKGETASIKLSGASGARVGFVSSDTKVAKVSSSGAVKAVGFGSAQVAINIGSASYDMSVGVGTKKAVGAVRWAYKKTPANYSQEHRMKKGYFDCSSLTHRAYKTKGVTLGASGWSPTAAMQAQWCARNNRVVYWGKPSYDNLRPGDLIFYKTGYAGLNREYKHIDHVAIYAGGGYTLEVRYGLRSVMWSSQNVVMVGRPTQVCYPVATASGVKVAKASDSSASLTWKKKKDSSGYQVLQSKQEDAGFKVVKTTTKASSTSCSVGGLKAGETYYFKVRAFKTVKGVKYYGAYSNPALISM